MTYGRIDEGYLQELASLDPADDGPIWMVNLLHDVRNGSGTTPLADDEYRPSDVLAEIGAEVVFYGAVEDQLRDKPPAWDRVAVVRFPSRRSFHLLRERADFRELHERAVEGAYNSFVIGWCPVADTCDADVGG